MKVKFINYAIFALGLSCTHAFAFAIQSSNPATGYFHVADDLIPNRSAFQGWEEKFGYVSLQMDLNKIKQVKVICENKKLYPTHADQSTKQYHVFDFGRYDVTKLKSDDEMCNLASKYKNSKGVFYCMRSDSMETAVISDTYKDACGNMYRGYWRVLYKYSDESMGTLFAKGRTMYLNPKAEYDGDYMTGGTYPVDESEFLFLSALFKTDKAKIDEAFKRNQTSKIKYNIKSMLFEEVSSN